MFELGYVRPEEVRQIQRLGKGLLAILLAPLAGAPAAPDTVLLACIPARAMLLEEVAIRRRFQEAAATTLNDLPRDLAEETG